VTTDLLSIFMEDMKLRRMSPGFAESNYYRVRAYLQWCDARGLDPLQTTREDILAYLRHHQGSRTKTLANIFSALASFYELLEERGESSSAVHVRNIRKKYLRSYKSDSAERQIISVEEAAMMVVATLDTRDRAMLLLLLKTGIRRGELASLETSDIDMRRMEIRLKPTAKRSNRTVFFDEEARDALVRWLKIRPSSDTLFPLCGHAVGVAIAKAAERGGLHERGAPLENRIGPHCCRHWFTTHLLRSGMPREYVKWLRGDAIKEAVDIYYHIASEDVRRSYLAHIPRLGV